VFRDLVLARIIESASKLDSLRVLEEAGVPAASYRTVKRAFLYMPRTPGTEVNEGRWARSEGHIGSMKVRRRLV
jgi:hypothetical protein